jgi:hypothetical protein
MTMTPPRGEGARLLPPPPLQQASIPVSPELALIDPDLSALVLACEPDEWRPAPTAFLDSDARDAMLRMCELSDVNPRRARRGRMLTVAVPAVLWAEAVLAVASLVPLGAL